jgi:hypothetical protein
MCKKMQSPLQPLSAQMARKGPGEKMYLQHLQLLQPPLDEVLHLALIGLVLVLAERVVRPPLRVLPEVVGCELPRLPKQ